MQNYRRYIIELLFGLVLALVVVAMFNWLVNPFNIFSSPEIEGFNKNKPKKVIRDRLTKVYEVNNARPNIIILGSSRSLLFPVNHHTLNKMTGYNLALASATTYETFRMFQHALALGNLKIALLGLDDEFSDGARQDFDEGRLLVKEDGSPNNRLWLSRVKDIVLSLMSYDALNSSIATIKKQVDVPLNELNYEMKKVRIRNAGGHRMMSRQAEYQVIADGDRQQDFTCENSKPSRPERVPLPAYFIRTLDLAYDNNIQMILFFTPAHARLYEAHCIVGNWPRIETLKRNVVKAVEQRARKYNREPFPVWDFTGYNSITTEAVPASGDKETLMKWYWESIHSTEEAGRLVVGRLFGDKDVPDDFGVRITSNNIEQHLRNIHEQRARYARANPAEIDDVRSIKR